MSSDARPQFVIAIYGVGNPAPGDVERSLRASLDAVAPGEPFVIHEFDWNQYAAHARRVDPTASHYGEWFAGSFATAAWCRDARPTRLEQVRSIVDGAVHGLWAATQSVATMLLVVALLLAIVARTSQLLGSWVHAMTLVGLLPAGTGWRSAAVAGHAARLALVIFGAGSIATAALVTVSLGIATIESALTQSMRPLATAIRRHTLIVLLVPCTLLSLLMAPRASRGALVIWEYVAFYIVAGIVGMLIMVLVSLVMGGARPTLAWSLLPPAAVVVLCVVVNLIEYLRGGAGRAWLVGAKVLLDIGLYVGSPPYRATIQRELDRLVASIPDRTDTTIWIVAHSLGSVIALDSLTHSTAWRPTDRIRLITLGSPIRRFFRRFFPALFFEDDLDRAAGRVASRVRELTWVNAYRRFDYVGTALGLRAGGVDLPTRQNWPAHVNYWGDLRVARTVLGGIDGATPIPPATTTASRGSAEPVLGIPAPLQRPLVAATLVLAAMLAVTSIGVVGWLVLPGFRQMLFGLPHDIQQPAPALARIRHERGFTGDGARLHHFQFDFEDDAGHAHRVVSLVPGFFDLWSDPRFDYVALARFVRASCVPERPARGYELGWSVPCVRSQVPIVFDRAAPSRFRVTGFDYSPGWLRWGVHTVLILLLILLLATTALLTCVVVPMGWIYLAALYAGHTDVRDEILSRWSDAAE